MSNWADVFVNVWTVVIGFNLGYFLMAALFMLLGKRTRRIKCGCIVPAWYGGLLTWALKHNIKLFDWLHG